MDSISEGMQNENFDFNSVCTTLVSKLLDKYDQVLSNNLNSISPEPNSGDVEHFKKAFFNQSVELLKNPESIGIDISSVPIESIVTHRLLNGKLKEELANLAIVKENTKKIAEQHDQMKEEQIKWDNNLTDVVDGCNSESVNDEIDPDDELNSLEDIVKIMNRSLNTFFDECCSESKGELKAMLSLLYDDDENKERPFVKLPDTIDVRIVMLLVNALIIEQDPEDPSMVKSLL